MKDEATSSGIPQDSTSANNGESKPEGVPESKKRKSEPASENLSNFSRVVPAQLVHISFPAECRFQPVRPVSTIPPKPSTKGKGLSQPTRTPSSVALAPASGRIGGGGGILILIDQRPDEEVEFIEEVAPATAPAEVPNAVPVTAEVPSGPHIALDENAPEAPPPASFDVCLSPFQHFKTLTNLAIPVSIRKLGIPTCILFVNSIGLNLIIIRLNSKHGENLSAHSANQTR